MKTIIRGAIVPALIVMALQCAIQLVFAIASIGQSYEGLLSNVYVGMVLSQMTLLIGAAAYARLLRHRSRASLSSCTVGGAAVGLLANLAIQVADSVIIFLAVAVMMDGASWASVLVFMFLSYLFFGIGGLVIGGLGGGAVGLLSLRRSV